MQLRVSHIVVDCRDPETLAAFWSEALGVGIAQRWRQYVILAPTDSGAPAMAFQRVQEPKTGKNRMHVDFTVTDPEEVTDRLVGLGAGVVDEVSEDGVTARVLADPEGNEFCLVRVPSAETA
ncbi:VOC family protein [Kitasatospora sp. KL5]|uniref:VOC family protein n=1 Tax=Kitasatospora sp. KL5 TaxID=3425125 RepID=UPI003D6F0FEA